MDGFSIIIPLFNKRDAILSTIQSVLCQSYSVFEIIVVDDGSTDGSMEILSNLNDKRINIFHISNSGPSNARNFGLQQARHSWTLFLDADDLLLDNALKEFANAIELYPSCSMFVGNFVLINQSKIPRVRQESNAKQIKNPYKSWFLKRLLPCAGTYVCRTSLLKQTLFDTKIRRSEDCEMLFRLFPKVQVCLIPATVMGYRRNYSHESKTFPPIDLDFKGHLTWEKGQNIWHQICLYELFIEAKNLYPEEARQLYPQMYKLTPMKILYSIAFYWRALLNNSSFASDK